jgi:hypothetical protein
MLLGLQRVTPEVEDQRFGSFTQGSDQRFHRVRESALRWKRMDHETCVRFSQPATE